MINLDKNLTMEANIELGTPSSNIAVEPINFKQDLHNGLLIESEVKPKTRRRYLTASYKLKILEEFDACKTQEEKGAIIRREGLYASRISEWRKQRRNGTLNLLAVKRGRKLTKTQEFEKIETLEQENNNLKKRLNQAEMIIGVQKKVSELFGGLQNETVSGEEKS